jgi:hypothetical protein
MLINTLPSAMPTATVLSEVAAPCAAQPSAEVASGAFVRAGAWISGGYPVGIAGGAGKAMGGYALGVVDPVRIPRIRFTAIKGSTVQSTVQHNTMTQLNPKFRGGVGPHPRREPALA